MHRTVLLSTSARRGHCGRPTTCSKRRQIAAVRRGQSRRQPVTRRSPLDGQYADPGRWTAGLRPRTLSSSAPGNRLVHSEYDRYECKPEHPPEDVHANEVVPIIEVEHGVSPSSHGVEQSVTRMISRRDASTRVRNGAQRLPHGTTAHPLMMSDATAQRHWSLVACILRKLVTDIGDVLPSFSFELRTQSVTQRSSPS